jgi:hypothetical protein
VVLEKIADEEKYAAKDWAEAKLKLLTENEIFTVGNLRKLSKDRIEKLGLPPVVTEYLLRVKAGGKQ